MREPTNTFVQEESKVQDWEVPKPTNIPVKWESPFKKSPTKQNSRTGSPAKPSPTKTSSQRKTRADRLAVAGNNTVMEVTYSHNVNMKNDGDEAHISENMFKNAEYEAKIAAIQNEFNALANNDGTYVRRTSPGKGMKKHAERL